MVLEIVSQILLDSLGELSYHLSNASTLDLGEAPFFVIDETVNSRVAAGRITSKLNLNPCGAFHPSTLFRASPLQSEDSSLWL